ncbi:unnamed protein product [Urochloa decumbens]|uniref:F-box domain-containing protein n=1 Tax=Urochloa decumbens TaxID=240449 RepID=A0ABC8VWZ6_9POAL
MEQPAASNAADWSKLPADILVSVLCSLEFPDLFSSAAVCTSWRATARDLRRIYSRPKPPAFFTSPPSAPRSTASPPAGPTACPTSRAHLWLTATSGAHPTAGSSPPTPAPSSTSSTPPPASRLASRQSRPWSI